MDKINLFLSIRIFNIIVNIIALLAIIFGLLMIGTTSNLQVLGLANSNLVVAITVIIFITSMINLILIVFFKNSPWQKPCLMVTLFFSSLIKLGIAISAILISMLIASADHSLLLSHWWIILEKTCWRQKELWRILLEEISFREITTMTKSDRLFILEKAKTPEEIKSMLDEFESRTVALLSDFSPTTLKIRTFCRELGLPEPSEETCRSSFFVGILLLCGIVFLWKGYCAVTEHSSADLNRDPTIPNRVYTYGIEVDEVIDPDNPIWVELVDTLQRIPTRLEYSRELCRNNK
jgi:hypothetical protein